MTAERPYGPSRIAPAAAHGSDGDTCDGDTCLTCSDVAVEVRIVRLLADEMAVVDTGRGEEQVSVALVAAAVDDTILVHAGEAIALVGRE